MSQAAAFGMQTGGPATPAEIAVRVNDNLAAFLSQHSGNARPSYATAGTVWLDTHATPWVLNIYDGANDIPLGTVNATSNVFTPANAVTLSTMPSFAAGVATGSANAIVVASTVLPATGFTLTPGTTLTFIPASTNGAGGTTLNGVGTGVKNVLKQTSAGLAALAGGEIVAGQATTAFWDGTQYQLLSIPAAGAFIDKVNGTATGSLTLSSASAGVALVLQKVATGFGNFINACTGAVNRWQLILGGSGAESGGNVGSDLTINRFSDAGALLGTALSITRGTGAVAWEVRPTWAGGAIPWDNSNKPSVPAPDLWGRAEFSSGTAGGTFTSGADQTRPLNTLKRNAIAGASLASNQITLPAGTYFADWWAISFAVGNNQTLLYNVTDAAVIERGETTTGGASIAVEVNSHGNAYFTLAAPKVLELRHRSASTTATNGMGNPAGFGTEVYADVKIWKVA